MSAKSTISWTDASWSPIRARVKPDAGAIAEWMGYTSLIQIASKMAGRIGPHCEKVSAGCEHCYSETNNGRCLPSNGTGLPFDRRARDLVDVFLDEKILMQPLHWRKPRRIFVCSQTDWMADFVTDEMRDRMMAVMALCPQHTFQCLTKRADRQEKYFSFEPGSDFPNTSKLYSRILYQADIIRGGCPKLYLIAISDPVRHPLRNLWLGVSVESQGWADKRIPALLRTPAAKRFLSMEPLLGPIHQWWRHSIECEASRKPCVCVRPDWVIVGGESGPGARPFQIEWAERIIKQCRVAMVPCFVKQLGSNPWAGSQSLLIARGKCDNPADWPEELRVQEFP